MNSLKTILNLILVLIIFNACKEEDEVTVVYFDRSSFPFSTELTAEEIDFTEPLNPMLFEIIYDTLILVDNWNAKPYYMELYDKKNYNLIMEFAKRGRGPYEYLSAYMSYKSRLDSSFFLLDATRNTATKYNIDSLLQLGENYRPNRFELPPFRSTDIAMLDSATALVYNRFYLNDDRFSNNLNTPLFDFNIFEDIDFSAVMDDYNYFTLNASNGYLAVSPIKNKIWVLYHHENRIDIYNKQFEHVKTLLGPEEFSPEYYLRDGLDGNHVTMKKRTRTFWRCFYTNNHIFVIYIGEYNREQEKPRDIYKFSWDGELIHRYILDMDLNTIYLDSNEEYIYGTAVKRGHYPKLIKYKIK